ncbi:MAG TPA: hypothetical protein V6D03_05140, partial [Candidatus Caenarcaniphilales bacterium]
MKRSSIAKFLLGSILGIAVVAGSSLAVGSYLLTKIAASPPKPIFANDPPAATDRPSGAIADSSVTSSTAQETANPTPAAAVAASSSSPLK